MPSLRKRKIGKIEKSESKKKRNTGRASSHARVPRKTLISAAVPRDSSAECNFPRMLKHPAHKWGRHTLMYASRIRSARKWKSSTNNLSSLSFPRSFSPSFSSTYGTSYRIMYKSYWKDLKTSNVELTDRRIVFSLYKSYLSYLERVKNFRYILRKIYWISFLLSSFFFLNKRCFAWTFFHEIYRISFFFFFFFFLNKRCST